MKNAILLVQGAGLELIFYGISLWLWSSLHLAARNGDARGPVRSRTDFPSRIRVRVESVGRVMLPLSVRAPINS